MSSPAGIPHTRILLGLILGAVAGCLVNALFVEQGPPPVVPDWLRILNENVTEPIGQIFLRLLFMTVVPLVFATLAVGVAQIGNIGSVGRVGAKTIAYFLLTSTIGAIIGLSLVNSIHPGEGMPPDTVAELRKSFGAEAEMKKPAEFTILDFVRQVIPRNPVEAAVRMDMLAIITFALLVGIGLHTLDGPKAEVATRWLEAVGELMVFIIRVAMKLAPIGVFCLIFTTTSQFGFKLLQQLGLYVGVVLGGLAIQGIIVLPGLVWLATRTSPGTFFRKARATIVTAFSTSSSNATLPTNLRVAQEEFAVPSGIAGFVLPLGATMCMSGTALFEGVTVVFLAEVMGVHLGAFDQVIVIILCVLTAVGAAGVPGGSIPLLAMVLQSRGIPPEAIAIVLGVDRILDMCRTTVNNIGDLSAAIIIARTERGRAIPAEKELPNPEEK